jgi:Outer membrane efflux protein
MNLTTSLLALALLGMDDPAAKPGATPQGTVGIDSKADRDKSSEAGPSDRIRQRVQDLKQCDQVGILGATLPKLTKPRTTRDPEAAESWPLTLQSAMRIALENGPAVRVIAFGAQGIPVGGFDPTALKTGTSAQATDVGPAPIVIERLHADASPSRFQNEVMAKVRSVEQTYWALADAHVQLWASDRAVSLADEILNRERAELALGRGTDANVAEAAQRLEQFKLDLVTRTSDVITAERQLRFILELPPADNRRIIPVTPATEARLEPVWDTCVAEMLEHSPEIVQRKKALEKLRDAVAIAAVTVSPTAAPGEKQRARATQGESEQRRLISQQEGELEQTIREQLWSLARMFQGIDTTYKQLVTAKRLRVAAASRLEAQRAYYEVGRITLDRFLDAVSQYAAAVGSESQYKATYNTNIVGLSEAKSTLLADDRIFVAEPKSPTKDNLARQPKIDRSVQSTAFIPAAESDRASAPAPRPMAATPAPSSPSESPTECSESKKAVSPAGSPAGSKVWTFSLTIGSAPSPVQIKGTISVDDRAKAGQ